MLISIFVFLLSISSTQAFPTDSNTLIYKLSSKYGVLLHMSTKNFWKKYDSSNENFSEDLVTLAPMKVMVFLDGTWLRSAISSDKTNGCPIQRSYGKFWRKNFHIDWNRVCVEIVKHLNLQLRVENLSDKNAELIRAFVFTSVVTNDGGIGDERKRFIKEFYRYNFDVFRFDNVQSAPDKCVDIALAVEMLHHSSIPSSYDIGVIVTGDKDFIPVLQKTRMKNKLTAVCSMKNDCHPDLTRKDIGIMDFDMIWMDDFITKIMVANEESVDDVPTPTYEPIGLPTRSYIKRPPTIELPIIQKSSTHDEEESEDEPIELTKNKNQMETSSETTPSPPEEVIDPYDYEQHSDLIPYGTFDVKASTMLKILTDAEQTPISYNKIIEQENRLIYIIQRIFYHLEEEWINSRLLGRILKDIPFNSEYDCSHKIKILHASLLRFFQMKKHIFITDMAGPEEKIFRVKLVLKSLGGTNKSPSPAAISKVQSIVSRGSNLLMNKKPTKFQKDVPAKGVTSDETLRIQSISRLHKLLQSYSIEDLQKFVDEYRVMDPRKIVLMTRNELVQFIITHEEKSLEVKKELPASNPIEEVSKVIPTGDTSIEKDFEVVSQSLPIGVEKDEEDEEEEDRSLILDDGVDVVSISPVVESSDELKISLPMNVLSQMHVPDLRKLSQILEVKGHKSLTKSELISKIMQSSNKLTEISIPYPSNVTVESLLEWIETIRMQRLVK